MFLDDHRPRQINTSCTIRYNSPSPPNLSVPPSALYHYRYVERLEIENKTRHQLLLDRGGVFAIMYRTALTGSDSSVLRGMAIPTFNTSNNRTFSVVLRHAHAQPLFHPHSRPYAYRRRLSTLTVAVTRKIRRDMRLRRSLASTLPTRIRTRFWNKACQGLWCGELEIPSP